MELQGCPSRPCSHALVLTATSSKIDRIDGYPRPEKFMHRTFVPRDRAVTLSEQQGVSSFTADTTDSVTHA